VSEAPGSLGKTNKQTNKDRARLARLKKEDEEFEATLGYITRLSQKKKKKTKMSTRFC
jgi:hypothetical protein